MTVTGKMLRDARNLLGWSRERLLKECSSKVALSTIGSMEKDTGDIRQNRMYHTTKAVITALEGAGIVFGENGEVRKEGGL